MGSASHGTDPPEPAFGTRHATLARPGATDPGAPTGPGLCDPAIRLLPGAYVPRSATGDAVPRPNGGTCWRWTYRCPRALVTGLEQQARPGLPGLRSGAGS